MAISKKGLRRIIVDEREFYWKFSEKIFVTSAEYNTLYLVVDFGWYDVWFYSTDMENKPPDYEPKRVTPKFVSESISFALNQGWIEGEVQLEFKNGHFKKIG